MKHRNSLMIGISLIASTSLAGAVDIFKANNTTALNLTGAWTGGSLPTSSDVAVWDAIYNPTSTLGSSIGGSSSWQGIRVSSPGKEPKIRNLSGATLTLGAAGIDMSAASQNMQIDCSLAVGTGQTWNVAASRTLTLTGAFSGSGMTLTKSGAGTLNLNGTSGIFSGNLNLSEGSVGSAPASGIQEISGAISGSATLSKTGAGALTLSGNNSGFGGSLNLSAGALNLGHASALGTAVVTIAGGILDNSSGGPLTLDGDAPIALNGDLTFTGTSNLSLADTTLTLAGPRSLTVSAGTLSLGGALSGSGASLTKLGAGTLEVGGGANVDLEGKLAIVGGVLNITGGSVGCGSSSGNLEIGSGGSVELNGGSLSVRAVTRSSATGSFRFGGGTLKARADSSTFMTGLDSAQVGATGAIIDLDGWVVTIAQPLLHDPALGAALDGGLLVRDSFGNGRLTLNGASTYTGPTVVESGTLILGPAASLVSPTIELQASGNLDALTATTLGSGLTLQGGGTVLGNLTIGSGATLSPGGNSVGAMTMLDTLKLQGNAAFQIDKSGAVLTADGVTGLQQVIYGGTLTVTASGGTLASGNSFKLFDSVAYAGNFTSFNLPVLPAGLYWETSGLIESGTIEVINTLPAPNFSPPAGSYLGAQSITITGVSGSTIHYTTDGSDPTSSPTAASGASPLSGIVVPNGSSGFTIKAFASQAGSPDSAVTTAVYDIVDVGTWTHLGSGNWSDTTKWFQGVVPFGSGITADFSTLSLSGNSAVTLDGTRVIGTLKFGDMGGFYNWTLSGSPLTLDNGPSKPVIQVASNTTTITAPLAGSNGYTKTGTGNLVSQLASSSLSGDVVISEGSVLVDRTNSAGTGTIVLGDASTGASEVAVLQRGSDPWPPAADFGTTNNITVAAGPTGRLIVGRQNSGNYAANYTGTITLNNNVVFRNNGGDRLSIEGKITGSGNVTIEGNRVNWNSSANDFVGDLTVAAGGVFQPNAPSTIPAASKLTINGSMGTNQLTGETVAIGSLNGSGSIFRLASTNPTLSIGGNGQNGDFQGVIQNDFPVVKTGAGIQIFSGANTYTGGTTVNGGTLLINNTTGSGTGTGLVTTNSGGTLGGSGTISGALTVSGGAFLAPGNNGIGTLSTGAATVAGTYQCQLSGASADALAVTGNLNLTGASLGVSAISAVTPGTYVIATYTGALTGTFASVTPGYTVDYATPNQVKLVVTGSGDPYQTWASGFGLSGNNALASADPDMDGLPNAVEFVLGGNPATVQDQGLLPTIALVTNPGGSVPNGDYLRFTYRRTPASAYLNPDMQFDADLVGAWTSATGAPGAVQVVTPGFFTTPTAADKVDVYVPRAGNAVNGRLFGRLRVILP